MRSPRPPLGKRDGEITSAAPRTLFRPLEAEVATLDLAHRLAIEPENDALDVVGCKVVAQTIESSRAVADDVCAMSDELVAGEVVGVRLKMRPDGLVCSALQVEAPGIVERGEMPVVGGIPEIALQPMRPMPSHRIGIATRNRPSRRRLAFLRVVAAIKLSVHQSTASAIVLDRGNATSLQHPFKTRRYLGSYVLPVPFVKGALEQCRYLLHG